MVMLHHPNECSIWSPLRLCVRLLVVGEMLLQDSGITHVTKFSNNQPSNQLREKSKCLFANILTYLLKIIL